MRRNSPSRLQLASLLVGLVATLLASPAIAQSFDPGLQMKGQMVKLAEQHRCEIETVHQSEALERLGGVGCLLRYRSSFLEHNSLNRNSIGDINLQPSTVGIAEP